jgi:FtsH-binding integral membrane protein
MLDLTTPALLFPAISLFMLAYTQRFLALANLVRQLNEQYKQTKQAKLGKQLHNLRQRVYLIRNTQFLAVSSFFCCVLCMALLFWDLRIFANLVFGLSLILLLISLFLQLWEIQISVRALQLELDEMET